VYLYDRIESSIHRNQQEGKATRSQEDLPSSSKCRIDSQRGLRWKEAPSSSHRQDVRQLHARTLFLHRIGVHQGCRSPPVYDSTRLEASQGEGSQIHLQATPPFTRLLPQARNRPPRLEVGEYPRYKARQGQVDRLWIVRASDRLQQVESAMVWLIRLRISRDLAQIAVLWMQGRRLLAGSDPLFDSILPIAIRLPRASE